MRVAQFGSSEKVRELTLYRSLLGVRPAQMADVLKKGLGISRTHVHVPGGSVFWVDPASQFGIQLLTRGIYEPETLRLLQRLLRPHDTFIDAGANEGYFSFLANALVVKGHVFAIEPQTRLEPVLRENRRVNDATRVQIRRVSLSDREGEATLYLRPTTNTGASSFYRWWKLGSRSETVLTTTLESFFRLNHIRRARLIKIDCEGAEGLIIRGAMELLKKKRIEHLLIMYHPRIIGDSGCRSIHRSLLRVGYHSTVGDFGSLYSL